VFTPTLFAGAALGFLSSQMLHLPQPLLLAVIGLSALLAAVTHAPIMATFMAAELTGQWHLLPAFLLLNLLALLVARLISPHSLYAIASPDPAQ
jgi:chloride channel protein, CIC family